MLLSVMLLLVGAAHASHFYGTMMTYTPKETSADGSVTVVLHYKLGFHTCSYSDSWVCGGNCGNSTQSLVLSKVDEISGEWCQNEGSLTNVLPNNSPLQLVLAGGNWISYIKNNIVSWRAVTGVELRNRSDTGKPNTSPQTTILPALRVPSNCERSMNLLAFDPDGDEVECRYGNDSLSECNPCTPPSVLSLLPSCVLLFNPTYSGNEGPYAVQLVMEDFPRQSIVLTQTDGSQEVKTTVNAISKIPLQFVLIVDSAVPSCTEGQYLPRFLPPTPDNRAQLYTLVNQMLEIPIRAEANQSEITELLLSGPYNVVKNSSGSGNFTLRWTPSESQDSESHPICFVVQATNVSSVFQSELRCVVVTVGINPTTTTNTTTPVTLPMTQATTTAASPTTATPATTPVPKPNYVIGLNLKISTTLSLETDYDFIVQQIKNEFTRRGLPSSITLRLLSRSARATAAVY